VRRDAAVRHRHDDRAARPQHPRGLGEHPLGLAHVLDDVEQQQRVGAAVGERQLSGVGGDHREPREALPRQLDELRVGLDAHDDAAPGTARRHGR